MSINHSKINHYENFPVASFLCPKALRPAVASVYWFARTADDLADEGDASCEQRLADLAAYRSDLNSVLRGTRPSARWHGLFANLAQTIALHQTPQRPFPTAHLYELLGAFEQDVQSTQAEHRYQTREELLAYCKLSANPVGRLMLHLFGVDDDESKTQSDAICSALQLINFWQDISKDAPRGRFYALPHSVDSLESLCDWARQLMQAGSPLCKRLGAQGRRRFGFELRLVVQGGLAVLDKIAAQGFDTTTQRPCLTKRDAPNIFWNALLM